MESVTQGDHRGQGDLQNEFNWIWGIWLQRHWRRNKEKKKVKKELKICAKRNYLTTVKKIFKKENWKIHLRFFERKKYVKSLGQFKFFFNRLDLTFIRVLYRNFVVHFPFTILKADFVFLTSIYLLPFPQYLPFFLLSYCYFLLNCLLPFSIFFPFWYLLIRPNHYAPYLVIIIPFNFD